MNFNRVILGGRLVRDPSMKYLPSNTAVAVTEFGLAVNHKWRDKGGEQREEVMFVDLEAFGRVAEIVNQYTKKGAPLLCEGRLKLDAWQGQDGQKHSRLKVIAESVQLIGDGRGRAGGDTAPQAAGGSHRASTPDPGPGPGSAPASDPLPEPIDDSAIPF